MARPALGAMTRHDRCRRCGRERPRAVVRRSGPHTFLQAPTNPAGAPITRLVLSLHGTPANPRVHALCALPRLQTDPRMSAVDQAKTLFNKAAPQPAHKGGSRVLPRYGPAPPAQLSDGIGRALGWRCETRGTAGAHRRCRRSRRQPHGHAPALPSLPRCRQACGHQEAGEGDPRRAEAGRGAAGE